MTIDSRAKGAGAELEFCNIVYQWAGIKLIRNLEQSRSGGYDLIVHDDETGLIADSWRSLAIEIKRHAKATPALIDSWWTQARRQSERHRLNPVLAYRSNRENWNVIVPLYLVNPSLTRNLGLDCTATVSPIGFCSIVSEMTRSA